MIIRQRTGFDPVAHIWRSFVCIDIGRPSDTTVPIELHPAVLEDMTDGPTEEFEKPKPPAVRKSRAREGARLYRLEPLIVDYLAGVGEAQADEIARDLAQNRISVCRALQRNPQLFEVDRTIVIVKAKTNIWRLKA